jgi:DNA adenine methylase
LIALLNNLDKIPNFEVPISKEEYDICRAEWRSAQLTHPDWYIGAVGYIASFGGRFYDGGYAKDVPASDPKRHEHRNRKNNILKQMPELTGCKFEVKDFFSLDCENAIIYCDPPYNGTKPYPYDNYDKDAFWNKVRELSEHNQVFISELNAPDDFKMVWHKKIKNTVGLNNSLDQVEKLFIKK